MDESKGLLNGGNFNKFLVLKKEDLAVHLPTIKGIGTLYDREGRVIAENVQFEADVDLDQRKFTPTFVKPIMTGMTTVEFSRAELKHERPLEPSGPVEAIVERAVKTMEPGGYKQNFGPTY